MRETQVQSLGQEDPLEKEMAAHSSILAWKIPWMEEPDRLQSVALQRVGYDRPTSLCLSSSFKDFIPSSCPPLRLFILIIHRGAVQWRLQHILTHFYKCNPQPYSTVQNILFKLIWILFSVLCLLFFPRKTNQNRTTDCSILLWNLGANYKHILNTSWDVRNRAKSVPCWLWLKKKGSLTWSSFFSTMRSTQPNTTWERPDPPSRTKGPLSCPMEPYLS